MRQRLALLFALAFLTLGCKPPSGFSGAKEPTPYTFALTEADIDPAQYQAETRRILEAAAR